MIFLKTCDKVINEMFRQNQKFGEQNHSDMKWQVIATEEIGEISKSILENNQEELETEIIQTMAVLANWLECRNRNKK